MLNQAEPVSPLQASDDDFVQAVAVRVAAILRLPQNRVRSDQPEAPNKMVRRIIAGRRLRDQLFDVDLFADPAWDILLDLYAAHLERGQVSVSSACIAAAVPPTTALRWIARLMEEGLIEREPDPLDGRRSHLRLTKTARDRMALYLEKLSNLSAQLTV